MPIVTFPKPTGYRKLPNSMFCRSSSESYKNGTGVTKPSVHDIFMQLVPYFRGIVAGLILGLLLPWAPVNQNNIKETDLSQILPSRSRHFRQRYCASWRQTKGSLGGISIAIAIGVKLPSVCNIHLDLKVQCTTRCSIEDIMPYIGSHDVQQLQPRIPVITIQNLFRVLIRFANFLMVKRQSRRNVFPHSCSQGYPT